jgi:regulatory protein
MPSITDLKFLGRGKQRVLVHLDGAPWNELDAETFVRQKLERGMELDAAAQARVLAADRAVRARKCAASSCARGPRTRVELENLLRRRGFDGPAIEDALAVLTDSGTLDETRATDAVIRRRRRSGHGPARIRAELTARGIDPKQAAGRLDRALESVDLQAECDALAARAAARHRPLDDPANRRKLTQYLLRRGYASEMAQTAVRRLARVDNDRANDD